MTLIGADFLVRMSTIAVAFVGWSAIAVTLRKALGYELDVLHMYFVRFFIEGGLAVAAFGLVPPVLALTELETAAIWRISSAAAALTFSVWFVLLFRRRRRVTVGPIPLKTIAYFATGVTATVVLWVNACGFTEASPGAYTLALVTLLVVGGWVFIQNLELFFCRTEQSAMSDGDVVVPPASPPTAGTDARRASRPSPRRGDARTGGTCTWRSHPMSVSRT